ncbi:hypothetical protein RP20_CCG012103 [Aedes albopictus]|nr:hypothetical protein RP20_CCG012103 [Aedes albopictus]
MARKTYSQFYPIPSQEAHCLTGSPSDLGQSKMCNICNSLFKLGAETFGPAR